MKGATKASLLIPWQRSEWLVPESEINPIWDRLLAALDRAAEIGQDILDDDKPDISQRAALTEGGWIPKTALEKVIEWLSFDFAASERTSVTALLSTIFNDYENDIWYMLLMIAVMLKYSNSSPLSV